MKVLHVIPSLSPSQGGPSLVLPVMAAALAKRGVQVDVVTTDDDGRGRKVPGGVTGAWQEREGWRLRMFPKQTEFYKVSLPLRRWLRAHVSEYDVVHVHAVFSFASSAACAAARAAGVPFIVRPLGVLNAWGMRNRRRWIKAQSFRWLDKPLLDAAAAIHYTSQAEADEAAALAIRARPVVIPLGTDLRGFDVLPSPSLFHAAHPQAADDRNVLFLSRLDPKKGLELLLDAFAMSSARRKGWRLVVAGAGEASYEASLKTRAEALGIQGRLLWTGFLEGAQKLSALAACQMFVLPSSSENFGIALLEAMASGLPCVSTEGVALAKDAAASGAVLLAERTAPELASVMDRLAESAQLRQSLGCRAADLARNAYSAEAMAAALENLYLQSRK